MTMTSALQAHLIQAGLLYDEPQLQRLEKVLPFTPDDRALLIRQVTNLRMQTNALQCAQDLQEITSEYNALVEAVNQHTQYLEINVAGFRKLLKRHEKQIPQRFRSRPMPCLSFHRMVTHTSRHLLDLLKQILEVIVDARQRLQERALPSPAANVTNQWPELIAVKGLGPECDMVLNIQRQLKNPLNSQLVQAASNHSGPSPGILYPRPEVLAR